MKTTPPSSVSNRDACDGGASTTDAKIDHAAIHRQTIAANDIAFDFGRPADIAFDFGIAIRLHLLAIRSISGMR